MPCRTRRGPPVPGTDGLGDRFGEFAIGKSASLQGTFGLTEPEPTIKYEPHPTKRVRMQDQDNASPEHDFRVSKIPDDIRYDMNVSYDTLLPVPRIDVLLYKIKQVIR